MNKIINNLENEAQSFWKSQEEREGTPPAREMKEALKKMMKKKEKKKEECCICKKLIKGYGHNANPVVNGRCCDKCNLDIVIPIRIKLPNDKIKKFLNEKCSEVKNNDNRNRF